MRYGKSHRKQRGIVLITMAVWAVILLGVAALAIDLGRVFINKSESQGFADAAALAAVQRLDGTSDGLVAARAAVTGSSNRWDFGTQTFTAPRIEFSRPDAPNVWELNPGNPTNYTRVRVTQTIQQRLLFAPAVSGRFRQSIASSAIAQQIPQTFYIQGLWPFAPFAFNGEPEPDFGLEPGKNYTIRYPGAINAAPCEGDRKDPTHKRYGEDRGWWGDNSQAVLRNRILNDWQAPGEAAMIGYPLPSVGGARTEASNEINARRVQDTDNSASNWHEYVANGTGNGRRIVVMPIQAVETSVVKGFGMFFVLMPSQYVQSGNPPWCVEYIGRAHIPNSSKPGAGPAGGYTIRLVNN